MANMLVNGGDKAGTPASDQMGQLREAKMEVCIRQLLRTFVEQAKWQPPIAGSSWLGLN